MKISVAMTTYNGEDFIVPQMDSIRCQTMAPDEVIIVDDCSNDRTIELVEDYINRYNLYNWKIILNTENIGWRKNFRKALFSTTGDIIFLADQDDIWLDTKVEETISQFIIQKNAEVIVTNYSVLYDGRYETIRVKNVNDDSGSLEHIKFTYKSIYVLRPGCTFALRKNILDMMRKYDDDTHAHDCIIWNLAVLRDSLYLFNRKLIYFRRHTASASTPDSVLNKARRIKEIKLAEDLTRFLLEITKIEELKEYSHQLIEIIEFLKKRQKLLSNGNILQILIFQLKAFKFYPTYRNLISDILVFFTTQ